MEQTTSRKAASSPEPAKSPEPSIADVMAVEVPLPEEYTRPAARAAPPAVPTSHQHPSSLREVIHGKDDRGNRIIGTEQGRQAVYFSGCRLCQHQDRQRMTTPPNVDALERTLFLVPETDYDNQVCRAYILHRYGDAITNIVHAFNAEKLTFVPGAQVIVVVRRAALGKQLGKRERRAKDEENKWEDQAIPPETYLHECVESAPIVVANVVNVTAADMYNEGNVDIGEFIARLSEVVAPNKIAIPTDPRDRLYVVRANT